LKPEGQFPLPKNAYTLFHLIVRFMKEILQEEKSKGIGLSL
jgi:hypothetical protein